MTWSNPLSADQVQRLVMARQLLGTQDRFRGLLVWGGTMIVAAPLLSWIAFVVLWP